MDFIHEERPSDLPFVERIWRSRSEQADPFISMADDHYALVVTKTLRHTFLTVRGPETRATPAIGLADAEFFGIQFKIGVYIPGLPPVKVMDRHDLNLPEATGNTFWLHSSAWQFPDFENADTFIDRLAREGLLVYDPIVAAVLQGNPVRISTRSIQRRFLQATGLTYNTIFQIERARFAVTLLKEGASILDAVEAAGYYDQPHLTRSLQALIGLSPSRIKDQARLEKLSYLYKTSPNQKAIMQTNTINKE
jgi:AraC-like DNA-binding protein